MNETTFGRSCGDDLQLRVPLVVAPRVVTDADAVTLLLAAQAACVGGDRRLVGFVASRVEEVDAERALGRRAQRRDVGPHGFRGLVPGGEEAEAARLGDRGGELRRRRAAGHRRADDRYIEWSVERDHVRSHSLLCEGPWRRN